MVGKSLYMLHVDMILFLPVFLIQKYRTKITVWGGMLYSEE